MRISDWSSDVCSSDLDGRLSFIAFLGGAKAEVNFAAVMLQRLNITGSTLRARPVALKAGLAAQLREQVWPLLEAGRLAPVLAAALPLPEAHRAPPPLGSAHRRVGKRAVSTSITPEP